MKKGWVIVLLMLGVCVQAAAGPDRDQKWDAGFNLSMADAQSTNMDESLYLSGSVSYGITEMLAVGASMGYTSVGFQAMTPRGLVEEGPDLTLTPIFGDIILRVPTGEQPFTPYFIAGLGAMLSDADGTDELLNRNANTVSEDAFASKIGGGLDWQVSSKWVYNFEIAYVFTGARLQITHGVTGDQIESNDLDFWYIGGGVKFLFD